MDLAAKYEHEAPAPEAASWRETIRYLSDETARRAYHSTDGLTDADINVDMGHGAFTIGEILKHQLDLVRFMTETLERHSTKDLPKMEVGEKGAHRLDAIVAFREVLHERFGEVLARTTDETLMGLCPQMPPKGWAEWPVLMRILRPLTDNATHVGQVNYVRRQLDKPVGRT